MLIGNNGGSCQFYKLTYLKRGRFFRRAFDAAYYIGEDVKKFIERTKPDNWYVELVNVGG